MTAKPASVFHPHALAVMILVTGLLATWWAYAPGLSGSLQFDDFANLAGLAAVNDSSSALRFIATGAAGPLGRPLALASFVPQASSWPHAPEVLLRTNILIHLLNGVLVTWFLYLLGRVRGQTERQAALIAAGSGMFWMLIPLLASSSLLLVQRMTTLSAVFMLLGMVAYMYFRREIARHPVSALTGMTFAIGAGTVLAALAKENGALLFLFVLAVEATLLSRPSSISKAVWRSWFAIVLIAPLVALVLFLASAVPYSPATALARDFTAFERVITQAGILWKYLYLAFIPSIPNLGPFHDAYPVQRSLLSVLTLFSIMGWLAVVSAAVILRRNAPLFTFAVTWYLLGHLLESTTLGLELYFEHRNYLPLIGPVYALVASLVQIRRRWRRLAILGAIAYAGVLGTILFSTTSLWGSPALAAEMWHIHNPDSLRATQHLAQILERQGERFAARRLLNRYVEGHPQSDGLRLQILNISCQLERASDHSDTVRSLEKQLLSTRYMHTIPAALAQLDQLVRGGHCPSIEKSSVYRLGQSLLENPRFQLPLTQHNVHIVMARIALDERDFGLAMTHIDEALKIAHNPTTLAFAIDTLKSGGRIDLARDLLAEARDLGPPLHPLRAWQWKQEFSQIKSTMPDPDESKGIDR